MAEWLTHWATVSLLEDGNTSSKTVLFHSSDRCGHGCQAQESNYIFKLILRIERFFFILGFFFSEICVYSNNSSLSTLFLIVQTGKRNSRWEGVFYQRKWVKFDPCWVIFIFFSCQEYKSYGNFNKFKLKLHLAHF